MICICATLYSVHTDNTVLKITILITYLIIKTFLRSGVTLMRFDLAVVVQCKGSRLAVQLLTRTLSLEAATVNTLHTAAFLTTC